MNVRRRIDAFARGRRRSFDHSAVERLSIEHRFRCGQAQRPVTDPDRADMNIGDLIVHQFVEQCDAGHRKIAAPPGEFEKSPATADRPRRQFDFGQNLVSRQRCRQRTLKEIGRFVDTPSLRSDDFQLSLAGDRDPGHLGSRVGVGDRATDRAAVPNLVMRNVADCFY